MLTPSPVRLVDADVGEDLVEPGPDATVVGQPVERPVGTEERLLHDILGGSVVVDLAPCVTQQLGSVLADEHDERVVVTRLERPDELGVIDGHCHGGLQALLPG